MTSLRTFQNEIEEIHTRELARQRALGHTVGNERDKENRRLQTESPTSPVAKRPAPLVEGVEEEDEGVERVLVSCDVGVHEPEAIYVNNLGPAVDR